MNLTEKIEDVQKFLNNIPNINYGGCGFAALAMYLYSEKNFGIKPKIFFVYTVWEMDDFENNIEYIKNNSGNIISPSHVMLKHNNKFFDSTGIGNRSRYVREHEASLSLLIDALVNARWNPDFNKTYVPDIEKELDIQFPAEIK